MSNTNVRNFVFGNSDIFQIADESDIEMLFETLKMMYYRKKGKNG